MSKSILKILILSVLFVLLSSQNPNTGILTPQSKERQLIKSMEAAKNPKLDLDYGNIPLYFIPNGGQVDEKALFYAKTSSYTLWLTEEELVFDSTRKREKRGPEPRSKDPKWRMDPGIPL